MILLSNLIPGLSDALSQIHVSHLTTDSRAARPGSLFFAIEGSACDGHEFIEGALKAGAVAAVVRQAHPKLAQLERNPAIVKKIVVVADPRRALGLAACAFYENPSHKLVVCGITGTNGKTTSTYLLEAILKEWGKNPAVIGTVENRLGGYRVPATHTTPDAVALQSLFRDFLDRGAGSAAVEVTSHAIDQSRAAGTSFAAALFTNLTLDHLDYHPTMEDYFETKSRLFTEYDVGVRVIHATDPYGKRLLALCKENGLAAISFGKTDCDVSYAGLVCSAAGIAGALKLKRAPEIPIRSVLLGEFNAQNIAGAAAVAIGLGVPHEKISAALSGVQVPGRMQTIPNKKGVTVVVDYAHTPDALEKALSALRPLAPQKLVCVFGCGGDRDPTKRPIMAEIAERLADRIIVTSDNPRTEDPEQIIAGILKGLKNPEAALVLADRKAAITEAIAGLKHGDLLLIAGKGHEDYQIIGEKKLPFDDRQVARENLQ